MSHHCPSCSTRLVADPAGTPLRCPRPICGWRLLTLEEWRKLTPFRKGYAHYMQADWPTSELKGEKNPYKEGSDDWGAFRQGEQHAVSDVQDGEE